MKTRTFRPSLRTMLILAFIAITVTPVVIMIIWLYSGIEREVLAEAHDKNQLLSENLANPVYLYLNAAQKNLNLLADLQDKYKNRSVITELISSQTYFKKIVLVAPNGKAHGFADTRGNPAYLDLIQTNPVLRSLYAEHATGNSGMILNKLTGLPALFFVSPAGKDMLVGELRLEPINSLAGNIHFGKLGHCAITDQFGHIVHHPNPQWMRSIKDISSWPIVKAGLSGQQGVMTFYSPFIKANMIAGYSSVPEFNWVILTPQPLSELDAQAKTLIHNSLIFGAIGLFISVALAMFLANWISQPTCELVKIVDRIRTNEYVGILFSPLGKIAPREIETLHSHIIHMAESIHNAVSERDALNQQLENRIREATEELTNANRKLSDHAHLDELTNLKNRRALRDRLSDISRSDPASYLPMQVMLFDVDQFKQINDTYGHDVGDQILTMVASEIEKHTRDTDFVVRYGGDEFLVVMPVCTHENATLRAEAIQAALRSSPLVVDGHTIRVTLSIGIADHSATDAPTDFAELLKTADAAMYKSKQGGRNRVTVAKPTPPVG